MESLASNHRFGLVKGLDPESLGGEPSQRSHFSFVQAVRREDDEQLKKVRHTERLNANVQTQKSHRLHSNASADEKLQASRLNIGKMHLTYIQHPWLTHFLIYFIMAFQLHGAGVSFTLSSKQVHVVIHLITEA